MKVVKLITSYVNRRDVMDTDSNTIVDRSVSTTPTFREIVMVNGGGEWLIDSIEQIEPEKEYKER